MDIHRCRFVPYAPASINALAFSHSSDLSRKPPPDLRLAIGRENSDIEIWSPRGGIWLHENTLRGTVTSTVEQLAWTQDLILNDSDNETVATPGSLRLFSIGGSQSITEWSLTAGKPVRHAEGSYRDIWCFAAQPAVSLPKNGSIDVDNSAPYLAAGCSDGTVVLFSTADNDLRYSRILHSPPSKKAKVLSITWRDRNTVVAGYEDGFIRIIDVSSRTLVRQMTLGKSADGTKNIVWTVKCLPDGTVLSGDSGGELKIWDSQNFSLSQRLKSHEADVLDIVPSAKGDLIFTVGVDRRTIVYQPQPQLPGQPRKRWAQALHRRYHDHDVKCAVGYESQGLSVMVSGGMDAAPMLFPIASWKSEYHRALPHLPQHSQMSLSRNRLVLAWWGRELNLYAIPRRSNDGMTVDGPDDYVLLATLQLKDDEHIQSAQLSGDGSFIVASTVNGVRLFQLRQTSSTGRMAIRSRAVALPSAFQDYGARRVGLSPDRRWLYAVRADNTILLAKMTTSANLRELPIFHPKIVRLEPKGEEDNGPLGDYTDAISVVTFAPDSRVLAVGTLSGHITSWTLEGHEDLHSTLSASSSRSSSPASSSASDSDSDSDSESEDDSPSIHAQRWTRTPSLPRLPHAILLLLFRPSALPPAHSHNHNHHLSPPHSNIALHPTRHTPHPIAHEHPTPPPLLALTASHTLHELDLPTGTFTAWSRRNPPSLLRESFRRLKDRAMGGWMHGQRLWLYGASWVYMMDLSRDFEMEEKSEAMAGTGKKRKRNEGKGAAGAGDRIKGEADREGLGARSMVRYKGRGEGSMEVVELEGRGQDEEQYEGAEGKGGVEDELVRLRRAENGHGEKKKQGNKIGEEGSGSRGQSQWFTFHYRAIFGIGVLSGDGYDVPASTEEKEEKKTEATVNGNGALDEEDAAMDDVSALGDATLSRRDGDGDGDNGDRLEVVIVERPMYEVGQAPRFDGGQDWDA